MVLSAGILMGSRCREFKRLDQFLSDPVPYTRPWEKYGKLPGDYDSESSSDLSDTADLSESSSEMFSDSESRNSESDGRMICNPLQIGDIVHWEKSPHVLFVVAKQPENGWIELLSPDGRQMAEPSSLRTLLPMNTIRGLESDNEHDLRFRQSLLERLTENQLDYLLSCME